MFHSWKLIIGLLLVAGLFVGCQSESPPAGIASSAPDNHKDNAHDAKISAVLIKLSPDDRQLAESQKFCAVMDHERLGGMGVPLKLDIKGQSVFVCCKGCKQKALKNPDETLAKISAMKSKSETARP